LVQHYLNLALAPSTKRTYTAAERKYLTFCSDFNFAPLPLCEDVLCQYAASLAKQSLKHQTIKTYLSALRYTQVMAGFGDPGLSSMPWLEYVLKGIKVDLAKRSVTQRTRLPITPPILRKIRSVLSEESAKYENMLWAICCTCFFGFLRSGITCGPK